MVITQDYETTTKNKGNPFDQDNFAVCLGHKVGAGSTEVVYHENLDQLSRLMENDCLYVFFNAKFDCSWHRRNGVDCNHKRIWCCQLAEFILEGQSNPYPSLEDTAVKYGLGHKEDVVKKEYWDKGIDTPDIPRPILSTYVIQDVDLTYLVYLKQVEQFKQNPKLYQLFRLSCQDLLFLAECEWNGLLYDEELCHQREQQLQEELQRLTNVLCGVYPDVPINFNSGDQLSAFLYGGTISEEVKEPNGYYKSGPNADNPKFRNATKRHALPQLVRPLARSELKKEGMYATDEGTLRKLKGPAARKYVSVLLEHSRISKLIDTYYRKLPVMNKEFNWPVNKIHGQFNQCVAATGRLSSSKPNLQNFAGECQDILISEYND